MAKNMTGTDVHVHSDGGQTVVVGPGQDFPEDFDAPKDLTTSPDEPDEDEEVAGPAQFGGRLGAVGRPAVDADAYKGWKVPELRAALGEGNYDADDRRDTLVAKATAANVDPNEKPQVS